MELGLRPGFTHIEAMAVAAQLRAMSASQHLPEIVALTDLIADATDDDVFFIDRWEDWRAVSLTSGVLKNIALLARSPALVAVAPGVGMQRKFYKALLPTIRAQHPVTVLRARLSHWFPGQNVDLIVWFAELRLRQCAKLKLPTTLLWSLLRLWCNALPTSRRFRNREAVGECPFGCGAIGGDDIRHLAICPLIFTAFLPVLGGANSWPNLSGLRSLFLLEPRDCSHEVVLGLALVDTLVHNYFHFRRFPTRDVAIVSRAFNERLCVLMQWSARIRSAVLAVRGGGSLLAPLAAS